MPKPTFFNLPSEKRDKIEQAAIAEFSEYSFDQASINRIIDQAQIPKGSFYQYFKDKKDLYRHVLDLIVAAKLEYLQPVMANPMAMNFFDLLRSTYAAGIRFAASQPQLQQISKRLLSDSNHPVYIELMQDNLAKSDEIFRQLIELGISRGEIRSDIDIAFVAHLISSINTSVADFYKASIKQEIDDDYMETVDKLIDFLKQGIGSSSI